jgi:hypothetical protein
VAEVYPEGRAIWNREMEPLCASGGGSPNIFVDDDIRTEGQGREPEGPRLGGIMYLIVAISISFPYLGYRSFAHSVMHQ